MIQTDQQKKIANEIKDLNNKIRDKKLDYNSSLVASAKEDMIKVLERYECGLIDGNEYLKETAQIATDYRLNMHRDTI